MARAATSPRRRTRTRTRAGRVAGLAALALALAAPLSCGDDPRGVDDGDLTPSATVALFTWTDGAVLVEGGALVSARIEVAAGTDRVDVVLRNAFPVSLPDGCVPSNVKALRSFISGSGLRCELDGATGVDLTAIVDGAATSRVGGTVVTATGTARTQTTETATAPLPERVVTGDSDVEPDLRLVSSPDFLNADVADLSRGPGSWRPSRSSNGTNAAYDRVLDGILDDWASLDPAAVLVAGDLVNGRWGYDDRRTGTFGPVGTLAQQKAALRTAARTYYPQWQQRFDDHGLSVFPTIGDHEYGDNPWGPNKRKLADTYRAEFARQFTSNPDGTPRYTDRPPGQARRTAFAGRPSPDLQIVSLDVFDITPARARIRLDPQQLRWLEGVLARAKRDRVRWIVIESHVPIAFPVRNRASSALHYEGGTKSALWKLMRRYDVDLYLSGEVHDTQLVARDGIVQVSHGGAFQFGLTTALVLDFYGDSVYLTLRNYDVRTRDGGRPLWETRREGLPARIESDRPPVVIGTASVTDGRLVGASGILTPVTRRSGR